MNKYPAILDKYFDLSLIGKELFEIQISDKKILDIMNHKSLKIPPTYLDTFIFIYKLYKYKYREPISIEDRELFVSTQKEEIAIINFIENLKKKKIRVDRINFGISGQTDNFIIKQKGNLNRIIECLTEQLEMPEWYNKGAMELFNKHDDFLPYLSEGPREKSELRPIARIAKQTMNFLEEEKIIKYKNQQRIFIGEILILANIFPEMDKNSLNNKVKHLITPQKKKNGK